MLFHQVTQHVYAAYWRHLDVLVLVELNQVRECFEVCLLPWGEVVPVDQRVDPADRFVEVRVVTDRQQGKLAAQGQVVRQVGVDQPGSHHTLLTALTKYGTIT